MKDMSIIANKKIINKETNEVRLVVSIDEENRKIHSVPVDEPNAEPSIMAAASYDRRWKLYEEPEAEARDLEIGYDRTVGFSHTNPTEAFKKTLEDNGFVLEVPFARVMPEEKAKAEREKPHRYVCPVCGQEVKTTADLSPICGICEVAMERAD